MDLETITKHWKPLKLRAIRLAKGIDLTEMSKRIGLNKTQINGFELGTTFNGYRNKERIYRGYEIGEFDLEPLPEELNRLQTLLNEYSREEIQMAFDIQTAEERHQRHIEDRRKAQQYGSDRKLPGYRHRVSG